MKSVGMVEFQRDLYTLINELPLKVVDKRTGKIRFYVSKQKAFKTIMGRVGKPNKKYCKLHGGVLINGYYSCGCKERG